MTAKALPMSLRKLFQIRGPAESSAITVTFQNEIYDVRLRRNRQARRYTLRIHAATREVVHKHGAWFGARRARLPLAAPLRDGAVVPLRGVEHRIEHRRGARGTVWVECGDDGASMLCVAGGEAHVARRVRDFLKREAKRELEAASKLAAASLGVTVVRVSVRDQASRWGSCSTTGVLSYSWRLILAPPFVLKYLAAHEVAHLVEMNHSRRFWRVVERVCPHMARAKTWLDSHGAELHRYGLQHDAR